MVLLEVPEGTVEIEVGAYADRTDITTVRIPASVKAIGGHAFYGCSGITTLHLAESLESIGDYAFHDCPGIVGLHLPASLRSIGISSFAHCTGVTSLRIPPRVQSIGDYAFYDCSGIVDLDLLDGLQSIGNCAFHACDGIETLILPSSLTSVLGNWSFDGCTRLARVLAPDAEVKGDMADPAQVFEGCRVLAAGLTPFSAVRLTRRRFWHLTMHAWCTAAAKACVLAVLVAELRVDRARRYIPRLSELEAFEARNLPLMPHGLWLLILEFAPRRELGAPAV